MVTFEGPSNFGGGVFTLKSCGLLVYLNSGANFGKPFALLRKSIKRICFNKLSNHSELLYLVVGT